MSSNSSDDKEECGLCGWGQTSKMCTSCEQKIESCNNEVTSNTASNSSSGIDAVSDSLGRVDLSNGDDDKMAISDEKLFADPPPKEDCPICMLPMPHAEGICGVHTTYMPCCGKILCYGCVIAANEEMSKGNMKKWCPYCRVKVIGLTDEENLKRLKHRIKLNDAEAFYSLGYSCRDGDFGLPQDFNKSMELWQKAAELGSICAHYNLAIVYHSGEGVEFDTDKAIHHYTLAAIGGDEVARYALGLFEEANGNINHATKHFMIAARCGYEDSLKEVGNGYKAGHITKDDYANTLRAYQVSMDEMKSEQRDIAAARR